MKDPHALVKQVHEVCPLPATVQRVVSLTSDPNANLQPIAEAVAVDPALTAEVLRIANGAAYGRTRRVDDLAEAIVTIGLGELHSMATAMAMLAAFKTDSEHTLHLHESALTQGTIARKIAKFAGADPRPGFLCGLLAEIGALACLAVDGEAYVGIYSFDADARTEAELARYRVTTRWVGARLLEDNNLSQDVVEAVGAEDDGDEVSALGQLTRFARTATAALVDAMQTGDREALVERLVCAAEKNNITADGPTLADLVIQSAVKAEKALAA